jgi:signal transduction histidine kinase
MKKNELKIINSLLAAGRIRAAPSAVLLETAASLAALTRAERVIFYLDDPAGRGMILAAEHYPPEKEPSPPVISPEENVLPLSVEPNQSGIVEETQRLPPAWEEYLPPLYISFHFRKRSALCLIMGHEQEKLKALSLSLFNILGETLGLILDDLTMREAAETRMQELSILHEIATSSHATLELEELLPSLVRRVAEAMECLSGQITLETEGMTCDLKESYSWPDWGDNGCPREFLDEVHRQVMTDGSIQIDRPCPSDQGDPEEAQERFISAFPLTYRQKNVGSAVFSSCWPLTGLRNLLFMYDKRPFFKALSTQVSMAVANSLNFQEAARLAEDNETHLRELSIFYQVSQVLADTRSLDDIIKVILTAATIGHGLGFNRAALFLINEKTGSLQGMMGVGPESAEEASRVWRDLSAKDWKLSEALKVARKKTFSNVMDSLVKSVRIPLEPESGILALCALEGVPYNVTDADDPRVNRQLAEKLGTSSFAAAPLMVEGKHLGVIAVDNRFNGRPITDEDLRLLSTFAGQGAMAIYNAQLYSRLSRADEDRKRMSGRLIRSERLAALGEMSATIAHEIRNPLVSIGGFARRMERRLEKDDPNRRYTGIILKELERLENFLDEILVFSKEMKPRLSPVEINQVISEVADFFQDELEGRKIDLEFELDRDLPVIEADGEQIYEVLMNLLTNSMEALKEGGKVTIKTGLPEGGEDILISFSDSGGGVPEEVMKNIFNPFFTTKSKGTGLGLPLIRKIVRGHGGSIEVQNEPGRSITFLIRLPVSRDLEKTHTKEKVK